MAPLKGWSRKKVKKKVEEKKPVVEKKKDTQIGLINELLANVRAENDALREACTLYKSTLAIVMARMSEVRDMVGGDPEGVRAEVQKVIDQVKADLLQHHIGEVKEP